MPDALFMPAHLVRLRNQGKTGGMMSLPSRLMRMLTSDWLSSLAMCSSAPASFVADESSFGLFAEGRSSLAGIGICRIDQDRNSSCYYAPAGTHCARSSDRGYRRALQGKQGKDFCPRYIASPMRETFRYKSRARRNFDDTSVIQHVRVHICCEWKIRSATHGFMHESGIATTRIQG